MKTDIAALDAWVQPSEEVPEIAAGKADPTEADFYSAWKRSLQLPGTIYEVKLKSEPIFPLPKSIDTDVLLSIRLTYAAFLLNGAVEIDSERRGGVPVLYGTRFPVAQVLGELADNVTVTGLARDYSLNAETIRSFLRGLAIHLDRPFIKK